MYQHGSVADIDSWLDSLMVRTIRPNAMQMEVLRHFAGRVKREWAEEEAGSKTVDDLDEMPPWERREMEKKAAMEKGGLPWPAYLGLAAIVTIASVGSCFELAYSNPIFGVVGSDSFAYKPILYWFIGTGFPLAAFLFVKGVEGANEAAELQDRLDGY